MIVLGRIVAPFGVQGWLRVHPFGDDPEAWRKMPQWWLSADVDAPAESWQARAVSKGSSCTATVSWPSWPASMTGMHPRRWAVVISVRRAMPCRAGAR
jgi:hypothetical protein